MAVLETFKELVNSVESNIASFKNDHISVCDYLSIDISQNYARSWVVDKLQQKIRETLIPVDGDSIIMAKTLSDLQDALTYQSVISKVDNSIFQSVLKNIASEKKDLKGFEHKDKWIEAIGYAKDFEIFSPGIFTISYDKLREAFPKQFDIAKAAVDLQNMGCGVTLNDLILEITGMEEIASSIEREIDELGGVFVMQNIFLLLRQNYYPSLRRYVVVNEIAMIPFWTKPMIPYGYILNLCVKHPKGCKERNEGVAKNKFDQIIKKATLLGVIADVRHYSTFEVMFQNAGNLPMFIRRLALFDSSFSFLSYDINTILDFMQHLFKWLNREKFAARFGFSIDDVIGTTRALNFSNEDTGPQVIEASAIIHAVPLIAENKVLSILHHLSHTPGNVNVNYKLLQDYDKLDFGFKPLIKLSETKFLLCDKSWCSAGFYEVLATMARELDSRKDECNDNVGLAIEEYVFLKLSEKGIVFSHGKYAEGIEPKGEADVVIESTKDISLIEIKKKVLTRKAKTGSDIQIIIDLVASLLDSHIQTGRTELILRGQGYIELVDGAETRRIELRGREIERIALTHWDYGSFQDRSIINSILRNLVNSTVKLINEEDRDLVKTFNKIQQKGNEWKDQATALKMVDKSFDDFPFFNCWFLSVPQLLLILKHCNNNEDFYKILRSTRHITLSSSNFYFEFYHSFLKGKESV